MSNRQIPNNDSKFNRLMNSKFSSIFIGLTISSLVFGVRSLGSLTNWELILYDRFLQWQPAEPPDPRILIVGIDEEDITAHQGRTDGALSKLINKLDKYQPRSIGLDIYRDIPHEPGNNKLTADLQANQKIVAICGNSDRSSVAPPPNVSPERVGFADFAIDGNQTVRRNLLSLTPTVDSKCRTGQSFGLVLAFNYLIEEGVKIPERSTERSNSNNYLQIESTIFKPIESNFGGYQNLDKDANGYQILLRYRFPKVAEQVTMSQVLNDEIEPNQVKDKIVLIGYTADSIKDFFFTPYSIGNPPETMPGVVIHAQMISQILSSVLDARSQIWVWNLGVEFLWILGWTTTGAWLFRVFDRPLAFALSTGGLIVALAIVSYAIFTFFAGWVPLLPALLAIAITFAIASLYKFYLDLLIKNPKIIIKEPEVDPFLLKGRYKIITEPSKSILEGDELPGAIGAGGFGIVYKAHDLDMPGKPLCAVKKLRSDLDPSTLNSAEMLFNREAETLYKLDHPQIPRLLAYFREGQEFYLVEQFIHGQTLRDVLNSQKQQSEDTVIKWLMEVLTILVYIHNIDNTGVIHRDIKPDNLILSKSGKLVLIDFGVVKILEGFNEITQKYQPQPQVNTSPHSGRYTPAEQHRGKAVYSSDLYALGIVAIEALTGVHAPKLELDDNNQVIWRNTVNIREDLALILDKMVRPRPIDRYQSAQEVIDLLSIMIH
jgi:CHASE2 domain-containing sensor protein/predicted Ser/Thr protein kinase